MQPTKKAADPLRAWRETAQAMTASSNAASAPPQPPGEPEMRLERERTEATRDALAAASRAVRLALLCRRVALKQPRATRAPPPRELCISFSKGWCLVCGAAHDALAAA